MANKYPDGLIMLHDKSVKHQPMLWVSPDGKTVRLADREFVFTDGKWKETTKRQRS